MGSSDSRGLRFKPSHQQIFYKTCLLLAVEKAKIKNGPYCDIERIRERCRYLPNSRGFLPKIFDWVGRCLRTYMRVLVGIRGRMVIRLSDSAYVRKGVYV